MDTTSELVILAALAFTGCFAFFGLLFLGYVGDRVDPYLSRFEWWTGERND